MTEAKQEKPKKPKLTTEERKRREAHRAEVANEVHRKEYYRDKLDEMAKDRDFWMEMVGQLLAKNPQQNEKRLRRLIAEKLRSYYCGECGLKFRRVPREDRYRTLTYLIRCPRCNHYVRDWSPDPSTYIPAEEGDDAPSEG